MTAEQQKTKTMHIKLVNATEENRGTVIYKSQKDITKFSFVFSKKENAKDN